MKTGENMFRNTFCPDNGLCFLAGESDSTMLRGWLRGVPYLLQFATIRQYSPPFEPRLLKLRNSLDYSYIKYMLKDRLFETSGLQFDRQLFGSEKFSEL